MHDLNWIGDGCGDSRSQGSQQEGLEGCQIFGLGIVVLHDAFERLVNRELDGWIRDLNVEVKYFLIVEALYLTLKMLLGPCLKGFS